MAFSKSGGGSASPGRGLFSSFHKKGGVFSLVERLVRQKAEKYL
jgi:hypothetical protein